MNVQTQKVQNRKKKVSLQLNTLTRKCLKILLRNIFWNKVTNILIDISISFFQHKLFQTVTIMWGNLT